MNESRKLLEVWKWKEDVQKKTENKTRKERIEYFRYGLKRFVRATGLKVQKPSRLRPGSIVLGDVLNFIDPFGLLRSWQAVRPPRSLRPFDKLRTSRLGAGNLRPADEITPKY
jgi:hypothetical protein